MQIVSCLFFPFINTTSPLNSFNSYNFFGDSHTPELSSTLDSSTINLFGAFFRSRIAVE